MRSKLLCLLFLASAVLVSGRSSGQEPSKHSPLVYSKWSGDINVPDPVAISVDNRGQVFITQTRRRKIQDLDIRQHPSWIPDDVGLSSVQAKSSFLKSRLAIDGDQQVQAQHVGDINRDGQHDWRDLTVVSEAIYRLRDEDGDGKADAISTFAEGFQTEVTGIAAGVLAHAGNVYATVAPDLWKLVDADEDGISEARESIAHGFGLHIAYAGHDMHGPIIGPDGRIYWSIGDKGIHVVDADGTRWNFPNQGGLLRCELDGSRFEVFAHGLRNVQEFDFDQFGNIFGIDNDADKPQERERFVWIVDGMDAGWRCNYQYRDGDYNPWTDEGLWKVPVDGKVVSEANISLKDAAAYIVPPISHYIDGPAGFKFNPGTALSEDYQNYFFSTGAPEGIQHAFRIESAGDSFKMVDDHKIGSGVAIVGIAFGPDGALYGADWDGGYPLDQKGSVAKIDVAAENRNTIRGEVRKLLDVGFEQADQQTLIGLLGHPDRRLRLGAQFELVRRDAMYPLSATAQDESQSTQTRLHALWGVAMLGRGGSGTFARDILGGLLRDKDQHVRASAAEQYAEMPRAYGSALVPLLKDESPYVRIRAGLSLARLPDQQAKKTLLESATKLNSDEHYLRHSLKMAMAACFKESELEELANNEAPSVRLCSVLALRQLESAEVASFLGDTDSQVATEAARAIYDDSSIPTAMDQLATSIEDGTAHGEAFQRRAINANFRLGTAAAAHRLVRYATSVDSEMAYRKLALNTLGKWMTPPKLDLVDGRARPQNSDRQLPKRALKREIARLVSEGPTELRESALGAAASLELRLPLGSLAAVFESKDTSPEIRAATLKAIVQQTGQLVVDAADEDPAVQLAAASTLTQLPPERQQQFVDRILARRGMQKDAAIVKVLREVIRFLGTNADEAYSIKTLGDLAQYAAQGKITKSLHLDIVVAAQLRNLSSKAIEELLVNGQAIAESPNMAIYGLAASGGDAEVGKRLFNTHVQAQCSRCHRAGGSGSKIGPDLAKVVKKRDDKHLLRSLLKPSADIEPKYQTLSYLMFSGNIIQGVPIRETDDLIVIADKQGKEIELEKEEIEESMVQKNSLMPDVSKVLTPVEIRDIIAFLRSL